MKNVPAIFLITFILFGMLLPASFVIADDGDDHSDSSDSDYDNSDEDKEEDESNGDDNHDEDDNRDEDRDEDEGDEKDDKRERLREKIERDRERLRIKEEIKKEFREDGKRVEIERKIEVDDDGTFKIKIKRKITNSNGTVITKVLVIERDEDGFKKKLKIEGVDDLEVETELEIEDEFEGNESDIAAILSNGNRTKIKIMPDRISEIALERLRTKNFTIELRETKHRNIPRVVYHVNSNKTGRFLGVFKLKLKVEGQIDPETGEFIGISKPWWAFLIIGEDSDQTDEDDDDTGEDENNETQPNEGNETEDGNETDTNQTNNGTNSSS